MRRKTRGFTLTEIVITVALLGLFTGLTLTAVGPLSGRYRRRQAAELVAATATRARVTARETGRCHVLEVFQGSTLVGPGVPGDRLRVARRANADCESAVASTDLELVEWVPMPDQVPVSLVPGAEPAWRPNGRLRDGGPAELRVASGGAEMAIVLAPQGPVCVSDVPAGGCP